MMSQWFVDDRMDLKEPFKAHSPFKAFFPSTKRQLSAHDRGLLFPSLFVLLWGQGHHQGKPQILYSLYAMIILFQLVSEENHQRHLLSIILLFKITVEEMNKDFNKTHKSAQVKDTTSTKQQ